MLFCALLCPPPGGAAGFPPAGPVHLADGFRLASRRAGGSAAFGGCAPSGLGIYGASPAPSPGVLFPRRKSTQKGDKRERDFDFPLPLITPSPLNDQRGQAPFGFPRGLRELLLLPTKAQGLLLICYAEDIVGGHLVKVAQCQQVPNG